MEADCFFFFFLAGSLEDGHLFRDDAPGTAGFGGSAGSERCTTLCLQLFSVCVFSFLLHTEDQSSQSASKVRTFGKWGHFSRKERLRVNIVLGLRVNVKGLVVRVMTRSFITPMQVFTKICE